MLRIAWLISIFPNGLNLKWLAANFLADGLCVIVQIANQLNPNTFRIGCLASATIMYEYLRRMIR
jgi:hypothetical protein